MTSNVRIGKSYELPSISDFGFAGLELLIFAAFIIIGWSLINKITSFDDHEVLFVQRNAAYAAQRAGLVLGQAIAMTALVGSHSSNRWQDIGWLCGGGAWTIAVLLCLRLVLSKLVSFDPQAQHGTLSVGVVRAAFYIAGGLIISAGLGGYAPSVAEGLASTVVFTLLGLLVLAGAYLISDRVPPFRLSSRVRSGNMAAALIAGGFTVALGLVLRNAIIGDFTGWASGLIGFAVTAVVAVAAFYLLCLAVDRWIITNATLAEVVEGEHLLAAGIVAISLIAIALGVGSVSL